MRRGMSSNETAVLGDAIKQSDLLRPVKLCFEVMAPSDRRTVRADNPRKEFNQNNTSISWSSTCIRRR